MKIYALRHGQTNYNQRGLCNGDPTVDVHLTREGVAQAESAAGLLRGVPIEHIYVSQLPRTRQTAEIINRSLGVPIEAHPALNDILTGCEGLPVETYFARITPDRLRTRPPNGESLLEFRERVLGFLAILPGLPFQTIALVAHEETLRVLYGHFHHLALEELPALSFYNCQILEFEERGQSPFF